MNYTRAGLAALAFVGAYALGYNRVIATDINFQIIIDSCYI